MAYALHHQKVMRVLLAENDLEFLELMADTLEGLGAHVVCARSGRELQDEITGSPAFDLVVTDVSMPHRTGLEVMASARAAGVICPIVVMTASRDRTTAAWVAALGERVALLYKPFSIAQLCIAMRACVFGWLPEPATAV